MFVRIWRYAVDESDRAGFETAYRPDGDWARLFGRAEGYLGTETLCGKDGAYLTIDRWRDESDWLRFKGEHGEDYRLLDADCESLTAEETEIGDFAPLT